MAEGNDRTNDVPQWVREILVRIEDHMHRADTQAAENQRRWDESQRRWEENQRRWDENQQRWDESQQRWNESQQRWDQHLADDRRRWETAFAVLRRIVEALPRRADGAQPA